MPGRQFDAGEWYGAGASPACADGVDVVTTAPPFGVQYIPRFRHFSRGRVDFPGPAAKYNGPAKSPDGLSGVRPVGGKEVGACVSVSLCFLPIYRFLPRFI